MDDASLQFSKKPQVEFENTLGELVERANRVLAAQEQLHSLLTAVHLIVEDLDLDRVLRHIAEAAVALVEAEYGALGVIDADGRLERFIHVGMPVETASQVGDLPEGHGILGATITGAGPIRLEDLGADPRSVGFPDHHPPMRGFLGVPIKIRGVSYGNLYLTNRKGRSFTAEDEELVAALAVTAAIAIDNARLYESSRRAQRLNGALAELSAALLESESEDAFRVVAECAAGLVASDLAVIVVPRRPAAQLRVEVAQGVGAAELAGVVFAGDRTLVARVLSGEHLFVAEVSDGSPLEDRDGPRSMIAVPLVVSGATVGAMCVLRRVGSSQYSAGDLETIREFARQAGHALTLAWARVDRERLELIEDRARIARDLHDNVIQRLFSTGLGLQALATALPGHSESIDRLVAEIDAAISDIRTTIFALQIRQSTESARHRLLEVISELTPALSVPPRIVFTGPVDLVVTGALAADVVSVVRECLTNVARHAHAERTVVDVSVTHRDVTVTVDDDGVGMHPKASRASGTDNLRARALSHGGVFNLEPRASGGTRAYWQVPLNPSTGET